MESRSSKEKGMKVECLECGKKFTTKSMLPVCPRCKGSDIDVAMVEARFNSRTKMRGSNSVEYAIYVEAAKSLGWRVKSFNEWVTS